MANRVDDFKNYAHRELSVIYNADDSQRMYALLSEDDPAALLAVQKKSFAVEYIAAKLALACLLWMASCVDNSVEDQALQKTFLKEVMNYFQSPDNLTMASIFSEYLYCQDIENEASPIIAIVQHLFKRLGIASTLKDGAGEIRISHAFHKMAGVYEAFKIQFQNNFFQFVTSGFQGS